MIHADLMDYAEKALTAAKADVDTHRYGLAYMEQMRGTKDMRVRVYRFKSGATKVVIMDESWLATTGGKE